MSAMDFFDQTFVLKISKGLGDSACGHVWEDPVEILGRYRNPGMAVIIISVVLPLLQPAEVADPIIDGRRGKT